MLDHFDAGLVLEASDLLGRHFGHYVHLAGLQADQPRGWVDMTIYNPYTEQDAYRAYRDAVYLNGAVFLESLRQTIGDAVFFEFLKDYAKKFAYQIATTDDFFDLLYQHTDADLKALEKEFFAKR